MLRPLLFSISAHFLHEALQPHGFKYSLSTVGYQIHTLILTFALVSAACSALSFRCSQDVLNLTWLSSHAWGSLHTRFLSSPPVILLFLVNGNFIHAFSQIKTLVFIESLPFIFHNQFIIQSYQFYLQICLNFLNVAIICGLAACSLLSPTPHTLGFWDGASGKESACQCRRCKRGWFDSCVRKILWWKKRQPTPVFLLGQFHRLRSWKATIQGLQRV